MDDFVAYPSPARIGLLVLTSVGFVALGLWMGGAFGPPPVSSRSSPAMLFAIGWFSVVFFGLCGVLLVKRLFDRREQVRIGSAGVRAAQWSEQTIPWSEIIDVTTWAHKGQTVIVLHLRDRALFPGAGLAGKLAAVNRGLTGGDISISLTGTNRSVEEALAAMARFRPLAA